MSACGTDPPNLSIFSRRDLIRPQIAVLYPIPFLTKIGEQTLKIILAFNHNTIGAAGTPSSMRPIGNLRLPFIPTSLTSPPHLVFTPRGKLFRTKACILFVISVCQKDRLPSQPYSDDRSWQISLSHILGNHSRQPDGR